MTKTVPRKEGWHLAEVEGMIRELGGWDGTVSRPFARVEGRAVESAAVCATAATSAIVQGRGKVVRRGRR